MDSSSPPPTPSPAIPKRRPPKRCRARTVLKYLGTSWCAIILLLFILTIGGAGITCHTGPRIGRHEFEFSLYHGAFFLTDWESSPSTWDESGFEFAWREPGLLWKFARSDYGVGSGFSLRYCSEFTIPLLFVFLVFATPPAGLWYRDWRNFRRRRSPEGKRFCEKCGYDLRLIDPAGRCPECGAAQNENNDS